MGDLFGGGAQAPEKRRLGQEFNKIFNIFGREEIPAYRGFVSSEPLLNVANQYAMWNAAQEPALERQLTTAFRGIPSTAPMRGAITSAYGQITPTSQLTGPLMQTYQGYLNPILRSGGALTPQLTRQATQEAAARNAAAGMATTRPGLFAEALNRDVYRQQRYGTALNQALGLTGQVSQLGTQGLGNAINYSNALRGLDLGNFQQTLGYLNALQGVRQAPLQNLLGTEQANISSFGGLLNPTANYAQDLFNTNYNAQAAANIANANKGAGLTGAGISALGSIGGAALSDERFKENIRDTGERTADGIPIKIFNYVGDRRRIRSVVAQDVEKVRPDAVRTMFGFKFVNLAAIGAPFEEVNHASQKF